MSEIKKSTILLTNRQNLKINGAESVVSLSENEAGIVVAGDLIVVKGSTLHAEKLSVETGELEIAGKINSIKFEEKREKQSVFKRIFK